ncbi:uncharacterized protein AMSG_08603 [Thecamonas trahens ATCC 50062]|uniref:HEAT repeat domain-containing protein n=1 Tax=Thecamonas trahens ATCC 50062 TaxID=461836 RepID=A0A0L0DMT2_THETB|nr:hypothetical protein AMSG_08603 [Thecamonas trahens ATCC 50062]KNC52723.1 hypothetical protein AMSG_08603 [Thecamonas trahens ATCC 50062]|eukprot:XP_013755037.1 hypothetical protein AMSG_08603 [Thecamonas trahens ATCC 50062]
MAQASNDDWRRPRGRGRKARAKFATSAGDAMSSHMHERAMERMLWGPDGPPDVLRAPQEKEPAAAAPASGRQPLPSAQPLRSALKTRPLADQLVSASSTAAGTDVSATQLLPTVSVLHIDDSSETLESASASGSASDSSSGSDSGSAASMRTACTVMSVASLTSGSGSDSGDNAGSGHQQRGHVSFMPASTVLHLHELTPPGTSPEARVSQATVDHAHDHFESVREVRRQQTWRQGEVENIRDLQQRIERGVSCLRDDLLNPHIHGARDTPAAFASMYQQPLPLPPSNVRGASLQVVHGTEREVHVYPLPPNVWSTSAPLPPVRIITGVVPARLRKQRDERNRVAMGLAARKRSGATTSPRSPNVPGAVSRHPTTARVPPTADPCTADTDDVVAGMEHLTQAERAQFTALLARVDDINCAVRCDAILTLARANFDSPLLAQALERHLADYDLNVQFQAALALFERNPRHSAARDKLLTFLTMHHPPETRLAAIRGLSRAEPDSGAFWESLVRYVAREEDDAVRFDAALHLAHNINRGHLDARLVIVLEENLGEADPAIVFRAAQGLTKLNARHDQVANAMLLLLNGSLWSTRVKVITNLRILFPSLSARYRELVTERLIGLLWRDPSLAVKEHAALALVAISQERRAFDMLRDSLTDRSAHVRRAALHCLQILGVRGEIMSRIILDALEDDDSEVRGEAARVAATLATPSEYRIVRKLRRRLADPNIGVRAHAEHALIALGVDYVSPAEVSKALYTTSPEK